MDKEEKKIEVEEEKILKEEEKIDKVIESPKFKNLVENGDALADLNNTRKRIIKKIAKHRFLFTLIVSLGIVLVWRGLWEISAGIPILSQSIVALVLGLGILWFIEKYSDLV